MGLDDNYDKAAKFNSGIAKLMRIGKLREGCHDARTYRDFVLWFSCLQGIRSEINSKLSKVSKIEDEKTEVETAKEYENAAKAWIENKKESTVEVNGNKGKVENLDIYELLYEYELWLGDIEEKYKFGMPDVDEDGL